MTEEEKTQRHRDLCWKIIEWKTLYYRMNECHKDWDFLRISDDEYDYYIGEYLKLCLDLGLPNTLAHQNGRDSISEKDYDSITVENCMMEPDDRPSAVLVYKKLTKPKGHNHNG